MKKILFLFLIFPAIAYSQVAKHNGGLSYSTGDTRYVNVAGDVMTGPLQTSSLTVTGNASATTFIGDLTGNASGTAATVTTAAQPNITSLGTLTYIMDSGPIQASSATIVGSISGDEVLINSHNLHSAGIGRVKVEGDAVSGAISAYGSAFVVAALQDSIGFLSNSDASNGMVIGTDANAPLRFVTGTYSSERMRITGGGNVGIGTTNPTQALEVAGAMQISGKIHMNTGYPGNNVLALYDSPATGNSLRGIGHTATPEGVAIWEINGDYAPTSANASMFFAPSDATNGSGNVGIGNTNPSTRLVVVGTVTATGFAMSGMPTDGTILCGQAGGGIGKCSGSVSGVACTCLPM